VVHGIDSDALSGTGRDFPYTVANMRVVCCIAENPVPVGWWRGVGYTSTAFVTESFIDELARAGRKDPVELRRRLLADSPRRRAVLDLAAEKSGWGSPLPPGRGRGIALLDGFGSIIAQVAEVSVTGNQVKVHRVVCAVDCGRVVNPDTVEAQLTGGTVFGLGAALKGEITFLNGRVQESNFDDYHVLRMNEMPDVEVHLVPSDEPPGGIGELAVPPIAPAVANAIFAATGRRPRRLPIRMAESES
jgi:isoquinoline 1-oxidoreductase beta subunit